MGDIEIVGPCKGVNVEIFQQTLASTTDPEEQYRLSQQWFLYRMNPK